MPPSSPPADAAHGDQNSRARQILAAQVRLLYRNANVGVGATLVATAILGRLQWDVVPHPIILAWCLYMFLVSLGRFSLARRYWRSALAGLEKGRWHVAFDIGAGLAGTGWGAAGILLYPEAHPANQVLLVFILGGMMLGAASVLAPRLDAFLAFILPTGLAPAVRLVLHGDEEHLALGLLAGIFTFAMFLTTRQIHLTIVSSLNLKFENQDLVKDLQASLLQRKGSAEALRESEQRFRAIFSQAAVGITQTSLDGVLRAVNNRACEMLGYTETELRGKAFREVMHPDDLEESASAMRRLLTGEIPSWRAEKRYIHKDGGIVWARVFISLVRDKDNSPEYFICVAEDVTDRVRADRARQDSERRLSLAGSAAHVGMWECDLRTKKITATEEFARLRGLAPDTPPLTYQEWLEFVHADDRERVCAEMRERIERKQDWDTEFRVVWPDASVHWLLSRGIVLTGDSGQAVGLVGVNLDITARKQAEAALEESEERFRNMADTAPVMIWVSGTDKRCTFFNRGWLTFTGSTMEQAVGNGWTEKLHPDDRDRCYTNYSLAFEAHRTFQTECRLRRADGGYRWVLATGTPRFESGGGFAGYVGSCSDITDVKRTQEEALARHKLESLGVLASGIAHDFNNLLGSIVANSELVLSELSGGSPASEGVESIRKVACRAAEIVGQMMAYAGQEDTVFEPVDLSELVNEMLQLLKVSISKRALLKADLSEELPTVRGNAAQLRQVVLNLITNASESLGEQEGVISVALTRLQSEASGSAPNLSRGEYVRLEVSDTGSGMTEEIQSKIFDPFFTTKFPGRGMGLAAVKGIVRSHGGEINVASAPGQGSRFEMLLPCGSEPAPEQSACASV